MMKEVLYLICKSMKPGRIAYADEATVGNWDMTKQYPIVGHVRASKHNMAGVRYDVNFIKDGYIWHGTQYGNNTMVLHCKRTKKQIVPMSH